MEDDRIIPEDQIVLAREFGLYDEWECRLENYLYDNDPIKSIDKEFIILAASSARRVASYSKHPLMQDDANDSLMANVSRSLYETIYESVSENLTDYIYDLHPYFFKLLCLRLCEEPAITEAVNKVGGLEEIDRDYVVADELIDVTLPKIIKPIIDGWGGIDTLFPETPQSLMVNYKTFEDLRKTDYIRAFNLWGEAGKMYRVYPTPMYLSVIDKYIQENGGEPVKRYFREKNQNGELEQVPYLPTWAVERYFPDDEMMKSEFEKYSKVFEEYYKQRNIDFVENLKKSFEETDRQDLIIIDKGFFVRVQSED